MKEYQYINERKTSTRQRLEKGEGGDMVFNSIFNNISVILTWQSVLLVEVTGVPEGNHRPAANHWQTLSHNIVSSTPLLSQIRTHNVGSNMH